MADTSAAEKLTQQQTIVPPAIQSVINDFAREADKAIQIVEDFRSSEDSNQLIYSHENGIFNGEQAATSSVTNAEILKYIQPKPGQQLKRVEGYGFQELNGLLIQLDKYLLEQKQKNPEYFPNIDRVPRWEDRFIKVQFGTNKDANSSKAELFASIDTAYVILWYIRERRSELEHPEIEKEEAVAPVAAAVKQEEVSAGGFIPIPTSLGEEKKNLTEKEKEEQEKKAEEQQTAANKPQNVIQEIARGDAAFHKEIIRMEQMVANQLVQLYAPNFSGKAQEQFRQEVLPYIAPYLYFELQRLGPDQLATALKSPKDRLRIYLSAITRLQQDASFRARLQLAVEGTTKEHPVKEKEADHQKQTELLKKLNPNELAAAIGANEDGKSFMKDDEIADAVKLQGTSPATLANQLRDMLGKDGAGIAESDVASILVRLQALAITRANVHRLTQSEFQEIFGPVFGKQNGPVFNRIQTYFTNAQLDWTRLFSAYTESLRLGIYKTYDNRAALDLNPDGQPSSKRLDGVSTLVQRYGQVATAQALYTSPANLLQKKVDLEAEGLEARESEEYKELLRSIEIKDTSAKALQRISALSAGRQRPVAKLLGFTYADEVYQQLHQQEKEQKMFEFWIETYHELYPPGEGVDESSSRFYETFVIPSYTIIGDVNDEGVYQLPDTPLGERYAFVQAGGLDAPHEPQNQEQSQVGGMVQAATKSAERWAGMAVIGLVAPEALPILEKIDTIKQFIGYIPGGQVLNGIIDQVVLDKIDLLGKSVILAAIAAILAAIGAFIGMVIFWFNAFKLANALFTAVSNLIKNATSFIKTFVTKTVLPTLSKIGAGIGHALSALGPSALGVITSITSASVFSGGLLASLTAGVMVASTTTLTNLNGAFQTNVSGSFSTAPHGNGAPNVGCYQFVSDQAQLTAFANQTGTSTKAFTPAEEQMVSVAGGIQFSYPTLTGKLCGPDMTSRPVKLIRANGRTWGGWTISADAVILYDEGILNQDDLDYTLWHEAGHIMDARNSGLLQSYAASYSGGRFETYPLYILPGVCSPFVPLAEAFAETISVYLMNIHHPNWPYPCAGGVYNLQTRRLSEYNWVQQNIYH